MTETNRIAEHDFAESMSPAFRRMTEKAREAAERHGLCGDDAEFVRSFQARESDIRVRRLAGVLGLRYSPEKATIARYRTYDDKQKPMLKRLKEIGSSINSFVDDGRGIVWFGSVGTGKDHCLAAMLYQACRNGFRTHWVDCQGLFGLSRDRIATGESERDLDGSLISPDVLGLSDLLPPAGSLSNWNVTLLRRVIDARNRQMRPTWATANAADERELIEVLTPQVWSRLRENADVFHCHWADYRAMKSEGKRCVTPKK